MKCYRQIMFVVCTIALAGPLIQPASAHTKSTVRSPKVQAGEPVQLPLKGKISVEEYYDIFLDLMARADSLTGQELLLYKQLSEELGAEYEWRMRRIHDEGGLAFSVTATGGETCATAAPTHATSFTDSDTTTGHVDDMDPATSTTCPAVGGGVTFTSTGLGEDLVYRINSPTAGSATVTMDPTQGPVKVPELTETNRA